MCLVMKFISSQSNVRRDVLRVETPNPEKLCSTNVDVDPSLHTWDALAYLALSRLKAEINFKGSVIREPWHVRTTELDLSVMP